MPRYRHAPGTIWRRAQARVERRSAPIREAIALTARHPDLPPFLALSHEYQLLHEAVRLANRLAYCAGIAGPLAHIA